MTEFRTVVTFRCTAFNTSTAKKYFVNPDNYGDDLARWVMQELKKGGLDVDHELTQKEHGWHFTFRHASKPYDFVVGYSKDCWVGWIERRATGFMASLLAGRGHSTEHDAARAIHSVLSHSPLVTEVLWHTNSDFVAKRTDMGRLGP